MNTMWRRQRAQALLDDPPADPGCYHNRACLHQTYGESHTPHVTGAAAPTTPRKPFGFLGARTNTHQHAPTCGCMHPTTQPSAMSSVRRMIVRSVAGASGLPALVDTPLAASALPTSAHVRPALRSISMSSLTSSP